MEKLIVVISGILLGLVIVAFVALAMGFPVMWLWNWLMPELLGLKEIGFWQAFGLNLLCGILFRTSSSSKD